MRANKTKCCIAIALALAIKNKQKNKKRRVWVKDVDAIWHEFTAADLLNELRLSFPNDFRNFLKMDEDVYKELMLLLEPKIKKVDTLMRRAITVNQRLGITLHFLATGEKFHNFKRKFCVSRQSAGDIVMETCKTIIKALKDYVQTPKAQDGWKTIAEDFYRRWNFPNCLGVLDGMHVAIAKPPNSGADFCNYKKFSSIALLAAVNANYEFLMVDVGTNGRVTDEEGVLNGTRLGSLLTEDSFNLPESKKLPSSDKQLPYVFITDDAYPLTPHTIKAYAQANLTKEQRNFNTHLNQVRRVGENAFGILVSRFGVLQRAIGLSPEKSQVIVLACCYLHNYLNSKASGQYIPFGAADSRNTTNGTFCKGSWRKDIEIISIKPNQTHSATNRGINIRDEFCKYLSHRADFLRQDQI